MIRMFFGAPGSGKTTFAVKFLRAYRGYRYSNFKVDGVTFVPDLKILGLKERPRENSYMVIDEAGIEFNSRKFKTFPSHLIEYFKLYRHYRVNRLDFFSQSWEDADITIRRLVDEIWYVKRLGPFSMARKVRKRVCVDDQTQQIIDGYKFVPLWHFLLGDRPIMFCLMPKYWRYFDSYDLPEDKKNLPYLCETDDDGYSSDMGGIL